MDETEGFQCLGHSNWTTCSPLSPFCSEIFPTFSLSYWGAHSYYPRGLIMRKGNSPNSQYGWDWGVSVPGAFKLDHLQPFKPILFWNFHNFSFSCPRAHFLYSPGKGEMEFSQPEWDTRDSVPGAFKLDHFQPFKPILSWNFSHFWLTYPRGQFFLFPRKNLLIFYSL